MKVLAFIVLVSGAWFFGAALALREGVVFPPRRDYLVSDLSSDVPMFLFVVGSIALAFTAAVS